jgi:hypothetical protein
MRTGTEVDVGVCACKGAAEAVRVEVDSGVTGAVGGVKVVAVEQDVTMNNKARELITCFIKRNVIARSICLWHRAA